MKIDKIQLVIDTREKKPLSFDGIETIVEGLNVGDYALKVNGKLGNIRVERKNSADLFSSFTHKYDSEKGKILRAKEAGLDYVLAIEATALTIQRGYRYWKDGELYEVEKTGIAQVRQIFTIEQRYGIKVWWCAGREEMAFMIKEYLITKTRWK